MFRNLLADVITVILAIIEVYLVVELTEYYVYTHQSENELYALGFLSLSALIIFGWTSYVISKFIRKVK